MFGFKNNLFLFSLYLFSNACDNIFHSIHTQVPGDDSSVLSDRVGKSVDLKLHSDTGKIQRRRLFRSQSLAFTNPFEYGVLIYLKYALNRVFIFNNLTFQFATNPYIDFWSTPCSLMQLTGSIASSQTANSR